MKLTADLLSLLFYEYDYTCNIEWDIVNKEGLSL